MLDYVLSKDTNFEAPGLRAETQQSDFGLCSLEIQNTRVFVVCDLQGKTVICQRHNDFMCNNLFMFDRKSTLVLLD